MCCILVCTNPAAAVILNDVLPPCVVPSAVVNRVLCVFIQAYHFGTFGVVDYLQTVPYKFPNSKGLWKQMIMGMRTNLYRRTSIFTMPRAPALGGPTDRIFITADIGAFIPIVLEEAAVITEVVRDQFLGLRREFGPFLFLPVLNPAALQCDMKGYRDERSRRAIWCQWWTAVDNVASRFPLYSADHHICGHESPYDATFIECNTELRCFLALVTAIKIRCRVVRLRGDADIISLSNAITATREVPPRFGLQPPDADFSGMSCILE